MFAGNFPSTTTGGSHVLGRVAGTETVTLTSSQMSAHTHTPDARLTPGTVDAPTNNAEDRSWR